MENTRNKHWRQEIKRRKYIQRLKTMASQTSGWLIDGKVIQNPKWIDVYNKKSTLCYKNTSTPCSCDNCKGFRYKREKSKIEAFEEINSTESEQ